MKNRKFTIPLSLCLMSVALGCVTNGSSGPSDEGKTVASVEEKSSKASKKDREKDKGKLKGPACPDFRRDDVKQIAVLPQVYSSPGGIDYRALITGEFTQVLVDKGYTVVSRDLGPIVEEIQKGGNKFFNSQTATQVGKLAGASHVVLVTVPVFQPVEKSCSITISTQIVEVETGIIKCSFTEKKKGGENYRGAYKELVNIGGLRRAEPASELQEMVEKAAKRLP